MGTQCSQIDLEERCQLRGMIEQGFSITRIACHLGRDRDCENGKTRYFTIRLPIGNINGFSFVQASYLILSHSSPLSNSGLFNTGKISSSDYSIQFSGKLCQELSGASSCMVAA